MLLLRTLRLGFLMLHCAGLHAQQAVWPLSGTSSPDTIAAQFGPRILNGVYDFHRGLDFRKAAGTPVYAPLDGTVVRVRPYVATGPDSTTTLRRFGNFLVLAHEDVLINGVLTKNQTVYQHLASFSVTLGQQVSKGQQIGTVGMSGENIYTEHLHFEWYHNKNNGDINRLNSRNPLELFALPARKAAVLLTRKPDSLQVYLQEANGYFGLKELVIRNGADTVRHIHFEKRISINQANEDVNPFGGLWIRPDPFTHGTRTYGIQFTFAAESPMSGTFTVKAVGVQNHAVEQPFETGRNYTLIAGNAGWRMMALPAVSWTASDIAAVTPVQGVAGSPWPAADPNVFVFSSQGHFAAPPALNTVFNAGTGLITYFFNNDQHSSARLPVVFHMPANEPVQDVSVPLFAGAAGRFTLVGNPFSTAVNLSAISGTGGNIQATVHLWDPETQSYKSRNRLANGGLVVAPWQSFWVETTDATVTSVLIPISSKSGGAGENYLYKTPGQGRRLSLFVQENGVDAGEAAVVFEPEASFGRDLFDAGVPPAFSASGAGIAFDFQNDALHLGPQRVEALPLRFDGCLSMPVRIAWKAGQPSPALRWEAAPPDGVTARLEGAGLYQPVPVVNSGGIGPGAIEPGNAVDPGPGHAGAMLTLTVCAPLQTAHEANPSKTGFRLLQNHPNPFNPATVIPFELSQGSMVELIVYDLAGRVLAELERGWLPAGLHVRTLDASQFSSGTYVYRLTAAQSSAVRKMVVLK